MTDRSEALRVVLHRVAACLHTMMAERRKTVAEVAELAGVSERALRGMLAADERIGRRVDMRVMSGVAAALGYGLEIRVGAAEDRSIDAQPESAAA